MSRLQWRCGLLLAALAGHLPAQPTTAAELIETELGRLQQARHLSYRATLVTTSGNELNVLRIGPEGLSRSNGVEGSLQRTPEALLLTEAGLPTRQLRTRPWTALGEQVEGSAQLAHGYRIQVEPIDRVDGREALPMRFEPVDRWRYGSTLWLDRATGLVIKTEIRGLDGQRLAQSLLTHLEMLGANPAAPEPAADVQSRWQVQGLPDGFTVTRVIREDAAEQLLVTDGLAAISVFVEPLAADAQPQNGFGQRGLLATIAQTRGDYQLVAVGIVPQQTIQRVLSGVTARH